MNIQVSKLRELMELLKPVVPKKPTIKALAYVYLGDGQAIASDLDTAIVVNCPEAKEPLLLPFAAVMDMLRYVPGNEPIVMESTDRTLKLTWAGGEASYPTEAVEEFPVLPDLAVKAEGMLDGDTLIAAMLAAVPYAATETSRPVLSGVNLVLGNPVEVCAGDGFRLSVQALGLSFPKETSIILPARSVEILGHIFAKTPRTPPTNATSLIPVLTAKRQLHVALIGDSEQTSKVRFDFGRTASAVINLIQGDYPNYRLLIPSEEPILQSQLFAPQFEAAVKRVRAIAKDGSGIVRLEFADGKVAVSAMSGDQNLKAFVDVINTQGEPGRTALNVKYLADFLAGKQGIITVTKYTPSGPLAFEYQNTPKVLIMPMFAAWPDKWPGDVEPPEPAKTETSAAAATAVAAAEAPPASEANSGPESEENGDPGEAIEEASEEVSVITE